MNDSAEFSSHITSPQFPPQDIRAYKQCHTLYCCSTWVVGSYFFLNTSIFQYIFNCQLLPFMFDCNVNSHCSGILRLCTGNSKSSSVEGWLKKQNKQKKNKQHWQRGSHEGEGDSLVWHLEFRMITCESCTVHGIFSWSWIGGINYNGSRLDM